MFDIREEITTPVAGIYVNEPQPIRSRTGALRTEEKTKEDINTQAKEETAQEQA